MTTINTRLILSAAFVVYSSIASAQFYKSVDEQGNIVYSDTPTPGAEQLEPPPISTISTPPQPAEPVTTDANAADAGKEETTKKPPTKYTAFRIVQPNNDDTIWENSGSIPVALLLEPPLDVDNGHSIWVYVDGQAVVRKSTSLVQSLSNIERGTHKIRAEIRNEQRKTLKRTKNVTVHLKRASSIPRSGP